MTFVLARTLKDNRTIPRLAKLRDAKSNEQRAIVNVLLQFNFLVVDAKLLMFGYFFTPRSQRNMMQH